ncbi:MAG: tRNA (adenosine(37)-N6)-threonylcarbamoyltransferase complex dimerization subunit type 1 TsaB [Nitriliruptorales bacterium]|nr:tRNA (adenosine(37)-N6)-threonylcarbamoyltransferase complex dimerization subunit type 1 TsaB [Nitriliruptorales bacterium]
MGRRDESPAAARPPGTRVSPAPSRCTDHGRGRGTAHRRTAAGRGLAAAHRDVARQPAALARRLPRGHRLMLVLGIETCTPSSSVCLANENGLLAGAALGRGNAHGEFVVPAIDFCLRQARLPMDAVAGIAVSLGPGLFTGMRVGIATAQMLGHARRLPVVGLNSLDLLAFPVRHARRMVCSVLDAKRGELFWAFYRSAPGGVQRVTEFRVGPPPKLAGEIEAVRDDVLCIGDGALAQRALVESTGAEVGSSSMAYPTAQSLVELALPRFIREETQRPEDLRPIYIRKADARINWQNRGALHGGRSAAPARGA